MSKIQFTLALHHDGRPQIIISTINQNAIQFSSKGVKFGNSNINGVKNRFDYGVSGNKDVTKLSLVMNTTKLLPDMKWASSRPDKTLYGKEKKSSKSKDEKDDRRVTQPSGNNRHVSRDRYHSPDRYSSRDRWDSYGGGENRNARDGYTGRDDYRGRNTYRSRSNHDDRSRRRPSRYIDDTPFNDPDYDDAADVDAGDVDATDD